MFIDVKPIDMTFRPSIKHYNNIYNANEQLKCRFDRSNILPQGIDATKTTFQPVQYPIHRVLD